MAWSHHSGRLFTVIKYIKAQWPFLKIDTVTGNIKPIFHGNKKPLMGGYRISERGGGGGGPGNC